ncbi:MAG: hypothetical protein ACREOH_08450, partial [Candidatus Entotheonellia bacterium]
GLLGSQQQEKPALARQPRRHGGGPLSGFQGRDPPLHTRLVSPWHGIRCRGGFPFGRGKG